MLYLPSQIETHHERINKKKHEQTKERAKGKRINVERIKEKEEIK